MATTSCPLQKIQCVLRAGRAAHLRLLVNQLIHGALPVRAGRRRRRDAVLAEVAGRTVLAALLVHLPVLQLHLQFEGGGGDELQRIDQMFTHLPRTMISLMFSY